MVVALRALNGEAENGAADGVHAVEHGFHAELFGIDTAFFVDMRIAEKAGGDYVRLRVIGKEVAGDLVNDEAVIRQVLVERLNDPIAIEPDFARLVFFVAIGIGVVRGVEPVAGPHFAVVRGSEEAVDLLFVGVGGLVADEGVDFGDGGRQAGEIEREAAEQSDAIGFGRGGEIFLFEAARG